MDKTELLTPKKIHNMPMEYVQITPMDELSYSNTIQRKFAIKVAEDFDNAVFGSIFEIAKEEGFTDLVVIDKEFVTEALKREVERRSKL